MFFVTVVVYFLLACCCLWLLVFSAGRDTSRKKINNTAAQLHRWKNQWHRPKTKWWLFKLAWWSKRVPILQASMRRHYVQGIAALFLIAVPSLLAFYLSGSNMLEGFDDAATDANVQVAELLRGEQLVPPPPLLPAFFTTQEVLQVRPMLTTASRNWALLNADYSQRLLLVFKIMKEQHGYDMAILEGYRSPQRQNMLASLGEHVTSAAAYQSYHQYGLAADCVFLRNGKLVITEKDAWAMEGYRLYGAVAESVGLRWGGRWKMMDFGHTELRIAGVIHK